MATQLMTVSGIAAETRVPEQTIRRWARRGLIDCQKDSAGRRLFDQTSIAQIRKVRSATWHERRGIKEPAGE